MVEPEEQKRFVERFIEQFVGEPRFDAFATFMHALPLDTRYNVARVMMSYDIRTTSPTWVTFALAVKLYEDLDFAAGRTVSRIQTAGSTVAADAEALKAAATAIQLATKDLGRDASRAVELRNTLASVANTEIQRATTDLVAALQSTIHADYHARRSEVDKTKRTWVFWLSTFVAFALMAGYIGSLVGYSKGFADGRARSDRLVRQILDDGTSHKNPTVRGFVINEFRRVDYWK